MSSFMCRCGVLTKDPVGKRGPSGLLLSIYDVRCLEDSIARSVTEFLSTPIKHRPRWVRSHFHSDYPIDLKPEQVVLDIISGAINLSDFSPTFICPACGRVAIKPSLESDKYRFYAPE